VGSNSHKSKERSQAEAAQAIDHQSNGRHASVASLAAVIAAEKPAGIAPWTEATEDLHVNLIQLPRERPIAEHVNSEVDVLILVLEGRGEIMIDGETFALIQHDVTIVRKGTRRSLRAMSTSLSYITCHRHRGGIWPRRKSSSSGSFAV
jgi:mannose-6-phosphate isomerase-like protein (cupin superfamily)